MIKFFRHIRQRLLSENKLRKYLLYAIGEIVLVVIGILIALQINNWNSSRLEAKQEKFYLEKLIASIKIDSAGLTQRISVINGYLDKLKIIETEMKDPNIERFSTEVSRPLLGVTTLDLETTTWENLKSTGKLELIKNHDLVDHLHNYYNTFENVNVKWNEGFQTYSRNILAPKLFEFDDYYLFAPEADSIPDDVQRIPPFEYGKNTLMRNAVRFRTGALHSILNVFEEDLERAVSLIDILEIELELND